MDYEDEERNRRKEKWRRRRDVHVCLCLWDTLLLVMGCVIVCVYYITICAPLGRAILMATIMESL